MSLVPLEWQEVVTVRLGNLLCCIVDRRGVRQTCLSLCTKLSDSTGINGVTWMGLQPSICQLGGEAGALLIPWGLAERWGEPGVVFPSAAGTVGAPFSGSKRCHCPQPQRYRLEH